MNYAGINAKVKAMRGKLLKYEDYYTLASSHNIEEIGVKLREYSQYIGFIDSVASSRDYSRHGYEQKITLLTGKDYSKIYNFISDKNIKNYLKALILNKEIHLIKLILCSLFDHRDIYYNYEELHTLSQYNFNFDVQKLLTSKNTRDFIDNLKDTEFYDILDYAYQDGISLFDMEMRLDFYYYTNLWKSKNSDLSGKNKEVMHFVNGSEIDLQNIIWVYRLKTYYNAPPSLIYQYVIPIHYKLSADQITKFVEAGSHAELIRGIKDTSYGYAFEDIDGVEKVYYKVMDAVYKRALLRNQHSIAVATDYLHRKQVEIENIISLIEGVRYSLKQEEIFNFIYVKMDAGGEKP